MPWRELSGSAARFMRVDVQFRSLFTQDYLAEYEWRRLRVVLRRALMQAPGTPTTNRVPSLSLVVWILKREVRAIRGCLGMHRR